MGQQTAAVEIPLHSPLFDALCAPFEVAADSVLVLAKRVRLLFVSFFLAIASLHKATSKALQTKAMIALSQLGAACEGEADLLILLAQAVQSLFLNKRPPSSRPAPASASVSAPASAPARPLRRTRSSWIRRVESGEFAKEIAQGTEKARQKAEEEKGHLAEIEAAARTNEEEAKRAAAEARKHEEASLEAVVAAEMAEGPTAEARKKGEEATAAPLNEKAHPIRRTGSAPAAANARPALLARQRSTKRISLKAPMQRILEALRLKGILNTEPLIQWYQEQFQKLVHPDWVSTAMLRLSVSEFAIPEERTGAAAAGELTEEQCKVCLNDYCRLVYLKTLTPLPLPSPIKQLLEVKALVLSLSPPTQQSLAAPYLKDAPYEGDIPIEMLTDEELHTHIDAAIAALAPS